jgi:FSR family fosmidomycin resistance protein-like MFS transporter
MRRELALFFLAHAVNDGFQFALVPLFPFIARELNLTYLEVGILSSSMVVSLGAGQFILGLLSDRFGKRKAFIASGLLVLSISLFFMSRAKTFGELLIFNFIAGFGLATYHPVGTTLITESFPDKENAMGIHGSGGNAGMLFFPFCAGMLTDYLSWRNALLILSPVGIFFALAFFLFFKEVQGKGGQYEKVHMSHLFLLIATLMCVNMVLRGFVTFYPLILSETHTAAFIGTIIALFNGIGIVSQFVGGRIAGKPHVGKILSLSLLLLPPLIIGLVWTESIILAVTLLLPLGFLIYIVYPVLFLIFSSALPEKSRATGMGIFFSVGMGGSALSPLVLGSLSESVGLRSSFFFLALVSLLGSIVISLYFSLRKK